MLAHTSWLDASRGKVIVYTIWHSQETIAIACHCISNCSSPSQSRLEIVCGQPIVLSVIHSHMKALILVSFCTCLLCHRPLVALFFGHTGHYIPDRLVCLPPHVVPVQYL